MLKVLVVDDEVPIRQWLEVCIQKMDGFQIIGTAAHGAEGYSVFRKEKPDIIITDIRMPGIDGLEMLKMIRDINPSVYMIVLTSHEDFGYARNAIQFGVSDYILKTEITVDSLMQLLKKAKEAIGKLYLLDFEKSYEGISNRNHFLRALVLKNQAVYVNETTLREYEIQLKNSAYFAIDIMVKQEEETNKIQLPDNDFLTNIVKFPLDLHHTIIFGNLNNNRNVSGQLQGLLEYCREILYQTNCKIGISDEYRNPCKLVDAMTQAHRRNLLSFYHPKETLFYTQNTGKTKPTNGEKYKILFNKELVNQNYSKAVEIKNQMMEEIRREEPSDIDYVKELYFMFVTALLYFTKEDIEMVEKQLMDMNQMLINCKSISELEGIMNQIYEEQGYLDSMNKEYSYSIRSAISYMENHYMEQITLADVAYHVSLSAEYLSRLFKEETGVKFIVYINNLRLKNAIYLLENTNLRVYEVAEKAGYSNLSYFSTVFKKKLGQNPFDYRNNFNK